MCQLTGNNGTFLLEGVLPNNVTLLNKTAQGDSWEYGSDSGRRCCFAPFASGKLRCLDGNTKQGKKKKNQSKLQHSHYIWIPATSAILVCHQ